MIGAAIIFPIPFIVDIDLEFSEPMDQTLTPGDINVEVIADAIPYFGAFQSWTDATHARYQFAAPWPPAAATIQLRVLDTQLQNLTGGICKTSGLITIVP